MRYLTERRKRKYAEGYGIFSFARKFGDKNGKKLRIDAAKIAEAEATGNLIGNKIADKITSVGKSKNKGKENETNEIETIYIPPEKKQQIIDAVRFF